MKATCERPAVAIPIVYIAQPLLEETARLLASFAAVEESEGVVYWFGLEMSKRAVVTTLIVPDADTSSGGISTSAAVNADAVAAVAGTPLVLLGQAHSHPSHRVGHSSIDDRETFSQFPGALSVVVPFYGRRGIMLAECGMHRHIDGQYRRLERGDVHHHLRVLPGVRDLRMGGQAEPGTSGTRNWLRRLAKRWGIDA